MIDTSSTRWQEWLPNSRITVHRLTGDNDCFAIEIEDANGDQVSLAWSTRERTIAFLMHIYQAAFIPELTQADLPDLEACITASLDVMLHPSYQMHAVTFEKEPPC